eukprot:TRINITY_DN38103_c0_g1_i1.p1 TRINITY_DN38103_c0_g1~~TRINITY_DN38103_c0_g1_i1.p1  ORF type:complete len:313 (+),score=35.51 TRINITY_DN38103_c0_g1_i1:125-1063(+)
MKIYNILQIVWVFFLIAHQVGAQCIAVPSITVSGTLVCEGVTVPSLDVRLGQQIGIIRNELGTVSPGEGGSFEVTGFPVYVPKGKPKLFIKVEYKTVEKGEWLHVKPSDTIEVTDNAAGVSRVDMGLVELRKHRCQAYTYFYEATVNYFKRVGERVPAKPKVYVQEVTAQPLPYVIYDKVISRRDFEWSLVAAEHELGHIIRHAFDGNLEHFMENKSLYGSSELRVSTCASENSEAFAFNEGWALFWAGQCQESNASGSRKILGNVAAALRSLQVRCGSSDAQMVQVLKRNPGVIYTYLQFEEKHKEEFECH